MQIIDKNKKYMFADEEKAKEWFDYYNAYIFDSELDTIEINVCYLRPRTFGMFYRPRKIAYDPSGCCIMLNANRFTSEEEWKNTLVHEMVHFRVYQLYGPLDKSHDKHFREISKIVKKKTGMDITTYCDTYDSILCSEGEIESNYGLKKNLILGIYKNYWIQDYLDEETGERFPIERSPESFAFLTTENYIPWIIKNFRGHNNSVNLYWYNVHSCEQSFLLHHFSKWSICPKERGAISSFFASINYDGNKIFLTYDSDFLVGKQKIHVTCPFNCSMVVEHLGTTNIHGFNITGYNPKPQKPIVLPSRYINEGNLAEEIATDLLNYSYRINRKYKYRSPYVGKHIYIWSDYKMFFAITPYKIECNPELNQDVMAALNDGNKQLLQQIISEILNSN